MTTAHACDPEEVMAYLDGQQRDETRAAAARAHLEGCESCREFATSIKEIAARLGEWRLEAAPASVRLPIAPRAEVGTPANSRAPRIRAIVGRLSWPRWVAVAGAAVVLLTAVATIQLLYDIPDAGRTVGNKSISYLSRESMAPPQPPAAPVEAQGTSGSAERALTYPQPRASTTAPAAQDLGLPSVPMVVRIATIGLTTDQFDGMRTAVERAASAHGGSIASLSISGESQRRALAATLRVPSARLDQLLESLRTLGRVRNESVSTQDVTSDYVDLNVRVANAKREEQRLLVLLRDRTGKLSEVLLVEESLARVRTDIERMEASLKATKDRVDLSTVNLRIDENYRAEVALGPLTLSTRLRNAVVDGSRTAASSVLGVTLGAIQMVPTVAVWALIIAWPARWIICRVRGAHLRA